MQQTNDRARRALWIAWGALTACLVGIALSGPLASAPVRVVGAWLAAGAAWAVAMAAVRRGAGSLRGIVAGAVVLRLVAAAAAPELTDDVHRYVWEGGLVAEGLSPYAFAPSDPALEELRERWPATYRGVGHPEVSAAYPPGMQLAAAATVALAGGPGAGDGRAARGALRALFGLCDLLVLVPLVALLRRRGVDPRRCVAWAFCPLPALEFAAAGHFDSLAILALVAGLAASAAGRVRAAGALLAGGALVKLLPLLALPFAIRERRSAGATAALLVVVAGLGAVVLGLEGGSRGLLAGLTEYGVRWEAGSLVHRWVEGALPGPRDRSLADPRIVARALSAALVLAVLALSWLRREDTVRAAGRLVGAFLLLTPTLHPWYVCWRVPFLATRPSAAWTWLAAAAPLLYAPLPGWQRAGVWEEPPWLWPVLALPLFALLAREGLAGRRARPGATDGGDP